MRFRILGRLEIWDRERSVRLRGAKRQIVLSALLLARDRTVPLSRFVDAVWGTTPPATADKQIRNAVSDLRNSLAGSGVRITVADSGYIMKLGDADIDAIRFTDHVTRAQRLLDAGRMVEASAELRAGLSLWRGPVLAGLHVPALQVGVDSLNQRRLKAFEDYVDLEFSLGEHRAVVGELVEMVDEHPLNERLAGQLMLALYRSGTPARALLAYERLRETLAIELGVDPGRELRELHQRILLGDPVLNAPVTTYLTIRARIAAMERRIRELEHENALFKSASLK